MNFLIFCVTFDAVVWNSLEAEGLYKRYAGWRIPLHHWLLLAFSGEVSRCRESDFMIVVWKRHTKGV